MSAYDDYRRDQRLQQLESYESSRMVGGYVALGVLGGFFLGRWLGWW